MPTSKGTLLDDHTEVEVKEVKGGFVRVADPNLEKPRNLTSAQESAFVEHQTDLRHRALATRQTECLEPSCGRAPHIWVTQVAFDFKTHSQADPLKHAALTSDDLQGPVPGFCIFHLGPGPAMRLAELIYNNHPAIQFGVQPNRWAIHFTDGTIEVGEINALPNIAIPDASKATQ